MKIYDIVTIGAATRDVFLQSKHIKIIRDENFSTGEAECFSLGSKIEIDQVTFETGGGGTNTAVGFSRQGWKTAFLGRIGDRDARGQEILKALRQEKVDVSLVIKDHRKITGYSVLLLTARGERTVLVYRGASADFTPAQITASRWRSRWIYVSSLGGQYEVLRTIWKSARRRQAKIAWNPGSGELAHGLKKLKPLLAQTDILVVNQEEAARLMGNTRHQDLQSFRWLSKLVSGITVVTQGSEGSLAALAGQAWHCGTRPISVVDTTGAGDAFGCGFVGAYIRTGHIPTAMRFATANSESVIKHIGAKDGLLRRISHVDLTVQKI